MARVTRSLSPAGEDLGTSPTIAATDSSAAPLSFTMGTVLADKLSVVKKLGEGGMGAVYQVQHLHTKHERALKVLHPAFAQRGDVVERFLREASAAGRIGSPHIVETVDAGWLASGVPFVLMELLRGQSLEELLAERGRIDAAEASALVCQACQGAQAAHDAGIIHRDLKPSNLFVVTRAGQPFVKLLDFGISKFEAEEHLGLTTEGTPLGTPYYMSPEQLSGRADVNARAGVYALGVILYECVAGQRPFEAKSLSELSIRIHEGDYTPLETLVKDVPADFVQVVRKAMHHRPEERFASARELQAALEAAPVAERPRRRMFWLLPAAGVLIAAAAYAATRSAPENAAPPEPTPAPLASAPRPAPAVSESALPEVSAEPPPSAQPSLSAKPSPTRRSVKQKLQTENPY